ncbi:DUF7519 family protein [Halococcus agarilyticus]|uniref:DUF7519 family protein n=1 Tax=Halococcus agarilyticus TaxID=1232219 RepID=UPI0012AB4AE4|nr:hypothetical protein [Halococcus agarilyticus]
MSATIDRSPARLSSLLGIGFGTVALLVLAVAAGPPAALPGLVGAVAVGVGVCRGSRTAITLGGAGLFVGIVVAGALGTRPSVALITTVAAVLAWDAGQNAVTVGVRLGRVADTHRIEVVHVAATGVVTSLVAGCGYVVAGSAAGSRSPVALVALLVAAIVLTVALRGRN